MAEETVAVVAVAEVAWEGVQVSVTEVVRAVVELDLDLKVAVPRCE